VVNVTVNVFFVLVGLRGPWTGEMMIDNDDDDDDDDDDDV
jgi:hypothetical protein